MGEQNPGETLGQYRLTECRAEGRIARICKGVDRTSGQKVLVRVIDPLAARNPWLRVILEELRDPRSPRRVQDPHLVRILDVGTRGESYYVAYEDFGGIPLDEYVQANRPSLCDRLRLAHAVAEGLRTVHGYKLIHGDVKPQNVLIGRDTLGKPVVKLALADLAHHAADATISVFGELVGTPKYLAPEVIQGRSPTSASDLFALGVLFYELFSGREPFPAATPLAYLHANVHADPTPLSGVDSTLPVELGRVVDRMLARQPAGRYRTAQGVLDDLDRVEANLDGVHPESVPPGADSVFAPAPSAPREALWRTVAVVAGTAAAVLLIALLLSRLYPQPPAGAPGAAGPEARPRPAPRAAATPTTTVPVPQALTPAREFAELQRQAHALVEAGQFDEATRILTEFRGRTRDVTIHHFAAEELAGTGLAKAEKLAASDRSADALAALRAVAKDYPGTPSADDAARRVPQLLLARARTHEERSELPQAIDLLESIQAEYRESAAGQEAARRLQAVRLRLAQALLPAEPDRAMKMLRDLSANKVSESDASAAGKLLASILLRRADASFRAGKHRDTLVDLAEVSRLDPSLKPKVAALEPQVLVKLALECKEKGDLGEAVTLWKQAQERYPRDHWVLTTQNDMAPLLDLAGPAAGKQAVDSATILRARAEKELAAGEFNTARPTLETLATAHKSTPQGQWAANLLADRDLTAITTQLQAANIPGARQAMERLVAAYPATNAAAQVTRELERAKAAPKEMVYVFGGPFTMGLPLERVEQLVAQFHVPSSMVARWFGTQFPSHTVALRGYCIDAHEVTNEEYKAFVDAAGVAAPPSPDWEGKTVKAGAQRKPVTHVTWAEASAYARWAGKRLPTEAEWEKAARGADGRLFPWGNEFAPTRCVTASSGAQGAQPVGLLPDGRSPYGALDMIGNVMEWTQDALKPYPDANAEGMRFDPAQKVARGAGWDEITDCFCLVTTRFGCDPDTRSPSLGFRCVKDVQ